MFDIDDIYDVPHGRFIIDYETLEVSEYGDKLNQTKKCYPAGKALITSKRLLLLSCQPT